MIRGMLGSMQGALARAAFHSLLERVWELTRWFSGSSRVGLGLRGYGLSNKEWKIMYLRGLGAGRHGGSRAIQFNHVASQTPKCERW